MLQEIRKNKVLNTFLRKAFKGLKHSTESISNQLTARWRTAGVIDCCFGGQNFKLYNECDDHLVDAFYYEKDYQEDHDLKLFTALARHSQNIIDIGANTGIFSVLSSLANKDSKIYAVEPFGPNFKRLNVNLSLNNCTNVKPLQVAMGENVGTVEFTVPESNEITDVSSVNGEFSKSMYPELKWKKETVALETLDHIKSSNNIEKIDLIKCDVETYEMSVFRGMDRVMTEDRPVILFECFLDTERQLFFNDILKKYNYYVYGVLAEGLVHMNEGFDKRVGGLNYLLSPVQPQRNFIKYEALKLDPSSIMA